MATCRPFGVALLLTAILAAADVSHERLADSSSAMATASSGEQKSETIEASSLIDRLYAIPRALLDVPSNEVRATGMFSYHKELFPLDRQDIITGVCAALGLLIAAGGGIGGGGILVPLFMILLRFRPKHAIALSNLTIFGGSIANVAFNIQKKRPNGKSMIDWDIIVIMEPSTIVGAVLGSFLSKYLPDFILTVSLCIVLGLLSWRTLKKGITMVRSENEHTALSESFSEEEDDEQGSSEDETVSSEVEMSCFLGASQQDSENKNAETDACDMQIPLCKVAGLFLCFLGCIVLTILKGSGHGSIIGVECGSASFWILSIATVPWVTFFGWYYRRLLLSENEEKRFNGHVFGSDEIEWNTTTTITYPLICTLAGVFAGLFGVGGGIVKGPLMLEMGVNPSVAAATAATMIFFTTSAACVSFVIFGLLEHEYGLSGFVMGLICTAVGQAGINVWMKNAKRQSPPVLSIGAVMALSTILVGIEAYVKITTESTDKLFVPSSICAVDH